MHLQHKPIQHISPLRITINPQGHAPRPNRKRAPPHPIDDDFPPSPAQDIGPAFAGVVGTNIHTFVGIGVGVCHKDSETSVRGVGGVPSAGKSFNII